MRNDDRDDRYAQEEMFDEDGLFEESAIEETLFRDEVIPGAGDERVPLPTALVRLRQLGKALVANGLTEAKIFRREAELVATFECEGATHAWVSNDPVLTYDTMPDKTLLAYFAWRTRLRRKGTAWVVEEAMRTGVLPPTGFLLLYVTELLNGVGVTSAQEVWEKIHTFWDELGAMRTMLQRVVPRWLDDLVIRDGLDRSLIGAAFGQPPHKALNEQEAISSLTFDALWAKVKAEPENPKYVKAFFTQLDDRSTYHPLKNDFGKTHEAAIQQLATRAFLRVLEAPQSECQALYDALRGQWWMERRTLFQGTLVDPDLSPQTVERILTSREKWVCKAGTWYYCRFSSSRAPIPGLTLFLRLVTNAVRAQTGVRKLKISELPAGSLLPQFIDEEVVRAARVARAAANPAKKLNFKQLTQIRTDAAAVREALIVPGSENDEVEAQCESVGASAGLGSEASQKNEKSKALNVTETSLPKNAEKSLEAPSSFSGLSEAVVNASLDSSASKTPQPPSNASNTTFTAAERAVLEEVLRTGCVLPPAGMSAEGFADRINERFMDWVGDTVLEVAAGKVCLVEDYAEEVAASLAAATFDDVLNRALVAV